MTYLLKRGEASIRFRRRAHLARYDQFGQIAGAWCPQVVNGQWMSSNVPWGLYTCKHCKSAQARAWQAVSS
jgi:hypothetical protein